MHFNDKRDTISISHLLFNIRDASLTEILFNEYKYDTIKNEVESQIFSIRYRLDETDINENALSILHISTDDNNNCIDILSEDFAGLRLNHFRWQLKSNKMEFRQSTLLYDGMSFIPVPSQNMILAVGGVPPGGGNWGGPGIIMKYNLCDTKSKWDKLNLSSSSANLLSSAKSLYCALTQNENKLIMSGGYINNQANKKIWILDLCNINNNNGAVISLRESMIVCPLGGLCMIMTVGGTKFDGLLVYGWIREIWNNKTFDNIPNMPQYLIDFICKWYTQQFLHWIFTHTNVGPRHEAIKISTIEKVR